MQIFLFGFIINSVNSAINILGGYMKYFLKKSTNKTGVYLQIYESHYIPGKGGRNKSYKALGYVEELIKQGIEDPIAHFQKEVNLLNEEYSNLNAKEIGGVSVSKNVGYFLLKAMIDKLDIDRALHLMSSNKKFQFAVSDFLRKMIYAQVVNPSSKHTAYEKIIPELFSFDESSLSYDQILTGTEYIGSDYPKYIELFNVAISKIWKRDASKVFFDCTNYYFEIDLPRSDLQKGPCKMGTHNPIIGQALLLDANQIPIGMQMYPGNESEKPYIRSLIEEMKERYDVSGRVIQVADKGLNCAKNIYAAVKEAKDGYIFSKSVHGKNLPDIEKKWLLLDDDEENKWYEVRDKQNNLLYKYKEKIDVFPYSFTPEEPGAKKIKKKKKKKRIVTYNPKKKKKQCLQINKEVDKVTNLMSIKANAKKEYGDAVKYVTFNATDEKGDEVDIVSSLNQEKIDEDKKYAGFNLIVTSETRMSGREIYKAYHGLWRIEESFRIMKSYLDARPAFVQKQETIYGHFLINYLSLVVLRLLELKEFNDELPLNQIITYIRDFRVTETAEKSYINTTTNNATYKKVRETLGIAKIGNLYLTEKNIFNILNSKI